MYMYTELGNYCYTVLRIFIYMHHVLHKWHEVVH